MMISDMIASLSSEAQVLLAIAILWLAGFLMSRVSKVFSLPNVTGYILAGVVIGPYCLNLIPADLTSGMSFITDAALALIAFGVGRYLRLDVLQSQGKKVILLTFMEAMADDFNTALAISYMFELSRDVNAYYNDYISGKIQPRGTDAYMIMRVSEIFTDMASTIGIFESADEEPAADSELVDKLMKIIVEIRQDARKNKNWAAADKIRDDLKAAGIILEDTPQGVKWKNA